MDNVEKPPIREPNLARWFWGAIVIMVLLSVLLSAAAYLRQNNDQTEHAPSGAADTFAEKSAPDLEALLSDTNGAALEAVKLRIEPLLDQAYSPVYAAIPEYADFHYSVWGEYAQLTAAALGDVGDELQKQLFSGLEARLEGVALGLDNAFDDTFQRELARNTAPLGSSRLDLGPLTRLAIDDALTRMQVTLPVASAAALGAGAAIKSASTAIAQKIAAKLAIKAAAKSGGKWAAVGTGAGAGAALCSWSGPGAGLCAAAGGIPPCQGCCPLLYFSLIFRWAG